MGLIVPELLLADPSIPPDVVMVRPGRLRDENLGVRHVSLLELGHEAARPSAGERLHSCHLFILKHVRIAAVRKLHGVIDERLEASDRKIPAH